MLLKKNTEIKLKLTQPQFVLFDKQIKETKEITYFGLLTQKDIYFNTPFDRLKIRIFDKNSCFHCKKEEIEFDQIIRYKRPDNNELKTSSYQILNIYQNKKETADFFYSIIFYFLKYIPENLHFIKKDGNEYTIQELVTTLTNIFGIKGIIEKKRVLYIMGQTRIHVDFITTFIETFIEFEVVLTEKQTEEEGKKILNELLDLFKLQDVEIIQNSYIDLI